MQLKKLLLLLSLCIMSACGSPDSSPSPSNPNLKNDLENQQILPEQLVQVDDSGNIAGILPDTIQLIRDAITLDNQIIDFDPQIENPDAAQLTFLLEDSFKMQFHQTFVTFLAPVALLNKYQIEGYNVGSLATISTTQTESPDPGHLIIFPATDKRFNAASKESTTTRILNGNIRIDKQNELDETFTLIFNDLNKSPASLHPSGTLDINYDSDELSITLNITFNQTSTTVVTVPETSQTFEYNVLTSAITETTEEETAEDPIVAD